MPSASQVALPQASVVVPSALGQVAVDELVSALRDQGLEPTVVDGAVAGPAIVAVGASVQGATTVVATDPEALATRTASAMVRCLADGGLASGPVLVSIEAGDAVSTALSSAGFAAVTDSRPFADWYEQVNGDVVGVVAGTPADATSAIDVLTANAQAGKVPVVEVGIDERTRDHLADGSLCAAIRPAARKMAKLAASLVADIAAGKKVPETALVPPAVLTGDGIADEGQ